MSIASEALAGAIQRRLVRSAVIKDAEAWDALYRQLQGGLTRAWDDAMREAITAALDRLRDLGAGAFTAADGASVLQVLEASVGAEAIRAAMREPVIHLTDALFRLGAGEVGQSAGIDIAFMRPDLDTLDALKKGNLFWVGESWNLHTRAKLNAVLTEYFTTGLTREGLAARMAEDFATVTGKTHIYWEMLADHIATKGREIGRVTGYERAGVERVQVRAQLDAKTSDVCKAMHGRIIEVGTMRTQADAYIEATNRNDVAAVKDIWTMHGVNADLSKTPTSALKGTASPPYHYRCRTITVAHFSAPNPTPVADLRQRMIDREPSRAGDLALVRAAAQGAAFLGDKQARAKFQKHRANIPTKKLSGFEADARALIIDPAAQVLLSARVPLRNKGSQLGEVALHAVFAKPAKGRNGEDGQLATIVDMEDGENGTIISHHWRDNETSNNDVSPATRITKGVLKWLTSLLG